MRLRAALPAGTQRLLDAAIAAAREQERTLWAVGGSVRDVAAGVPPREADIAVDGAVGRLARTTATALGLPASAVRVEPRFGTASIELPRTTEGEEAGGHLDLARLRTERYRSPGALPEVRHGATIEQDLARRDFTVNAVALLLTDAAGAARAGDIVDPLGGLDDLAAGVLRAHHPHSFADDATRLWRGARYAARLSLRPEQQTALWIEEGGRWLEPISGRRLWAELERLAAERTGGAALALLRAWGVLAATHPDLDPAGGALRALRRRRGPLPPALLFALLLAERPADARARAGHRLAASRASLIAAEGAAALLTAGRQGGVTPPDAVSLDRLAASTATARQAALWLDGSSQRPLQRALRRWERTRSPLSAPELVKLGVAPGPSLGGLLALLRRERYLGTLRGVAQARARVRRELAAVRRSEDGKR